METRIVQTELYAEHLYLEKFHLFRRIVPKDEIKYLKIHKNEMTKFYFEKDKIIANWLIKYINNLECKLYECGLKWNG